MSLYNVLDTGASGLTANRFWLEAIANNIANANVTRTPQGGPYQRQMPVFQQLLDQETGMGKGVEVVGTVRDTAPGQLVYKPGHPDADPNGFVHMPNVNVVNEMVDMITVQRTYDSNISVINAAKNMQTKALDIGK